MTPGGHPRHRTAVALSLLCERLAGTGHVHGVDRSAAMIRAAAQRGAVHVAAWVLALTQTSVQDLDLPAGHLDHVLAVRVREVHDDGAVVLPLLHRWPRPAVRCAWSSMPGRADPLTPLRPGSWRCCRRTAS